MEVIMLKPTRWNGKSIAQGNIAEVDSATAQRWIRAEIAEVVLKESTEDNADNNKVASNNELNELTKMKPKDLYALCIEKGLDVEQKKDAEYYIAKLTQPTE